MKKFLIWFIPGIIVGILIMVASGLAIKRTSTNDYCISCHIHPEADASWKHTVHYITKSGDRTACVECHLPPEGNGYLLAKVSTGLRDLWSYWTKDSASFNWEESGKLENARAHVYESSCINAMKIYFHWNSLKMARMRIFTTNRLKKTPDLHCINCHLNAGHFIKGYTHGSNKLSAVLPLNRGNIH